MSPGPVPDIAHGGTDAADSDDNARSSFGCDRLSVDQAGGDVDEVPRADLDQLAAPGPNWTVITLLVM
jgi:hypothetical protein